MDKASNHLTTQCNFFYVFQGNVEIWLGNLLKEMQNSLHSVIRQAFYGIEDSAFKMLEFQVRYLIAAFYNLANSI